MHWVEPPEAHTSVAKALRQLMRLKHVSWLHFSSMLDVLSARQSKRYPLATWEEQLSPTPCRLGYRHELVRAAQGALRTAPPLRRIASGVYVAAHVRALQRDRYKSESAQEYVARLADLAHQARDLARDAGSGVGAMGRSGAGTSRSGTRAITLFIATDDPANVLPIAASGLAAYNVTIVSRLSCDAAAVSRIHSDGDVARMLLDVTALVKAAAFSPAPRSGLSLHVASLRGCEHRGLPCDPAAACVRYASSGCGGAFPQSLMRRAGSSSSLDVHLARESGPRRDCTSSARRRAGRSQGRV